MNVLLDECIPRKLKKLLPGHTVQTVPEMGWASMTNGILIDLAETQFEVMITVDKSMKHQQRLSSAQMGFIVLRCYSNTIASLAPFATEILDAIDAINSGDVIIIDTRTRVSVSFW
jgi:predicted nuclease of predicted toxin-antitoxin system